MSFFLTLTSAATKCAKRVDGTDTYLANVIPSASVLPKRRTSGAHATALLGLTLSK